VKKQERSPTPADILVDITGADPGWGRGLKPPLPILTQYWAIMSLVFVV